MYFYQIFSFCAESEQCGLLRQHVKHFDANFCSKKLEFNPSKAEQPLQGMKLPEKEENKHER